MDNPRPINEHRKKMALELIASLDEQQQQSYEALEKKRDEVLGQLGTLKKSLMLAKRALPERVSIDDAIQRHGLENRPKTVELAGIAAYLAAADIADDVRNIVAHKTGERESICHQANTLLPEVDGTNVFPVQTPPVKGGSAHIADPALQKERIDKVNFEKTCFYGLLNGFRELFVTEGTMNVQGLTNYGSAEISFNEKAQKLPKNLAADTRIDELIDAFSGSAQQGLEQFMNGLHSAFKAYKGFAELSEANADGTPTYSGRELYALLVGAGNGEQGAYTQFAYQFELGIKDAVAGITQLETSLQLALPSVETARHNLHLDSTQYVTFKDQE